MNIIISILFSIILISAVKKKVAQNESIKWLGTICRNLECHIECIGICGSDACQGRIYYASIKRKEQNHDR